MIESLTKWLRLTKQQATIISILYNLQERKVATNPVSIEKEYLQETKTFIQKSNLFTQLKILQSRGFIVKTGQSQYRLNTPGIQEAIFSQKKELSLEIEEITKFANDTEAFFEKVVKPSAVSVTFLSASELFSKLTFYLRNAKFYYLGTNFPPYAFSLALCSSSQEAAYLEMLNTKLHDQSFSLFCLSPYKLESLSSKLHQKYKNKELIKEELLAVQENTKKKTKQFKNIDLRKTFTPFNFALIENNEDGDALIMFLRDSSNQISGGIFINSKETIKQTKQHFLEQMGQNIPMKNDEDFPNVITDEMIKGFDVSKKKKMIIFDVNRIFTQKHTTVELANFIGREKQVTEFIFQQIEGTMTLHDAVINSAKLLKGLTVSDINSLIPKIQLIRNVHKGLQRLKEAGYYLVAISSGFSQIVTPICKDLGIDEVYCNVLEEKDGVITGEVKEKNVITDNVKYYIAKYIMERHDIPQGKTIGVGDGFSDIPMLKATNVKITFNPSNKMVELFENNDPLLDYMVKEPDFNLLVKQILKLK